jgi:hypothetical protein
MPSYLQRLNTQSRSTTLFVVTTVIQQFKKLCVMEHKDSLWSSQKPPTVFHPETIQSIQRLQSWFLLAEFITVRPTLANHQQQPLSNRLSG